MNILKKKKLKIKARIRKSRIDIKKKLAKVRTKARAIKTRKDIKKNLKNFFEWVKGAGYVLWIE